MKQTVVVFWGKSKNYIYIYIRDEPGKQKINYTWSRLEIELELVNSFNIYSYMTGKQFSSICSGEKRLSTSCLHRNKVKHTCKVARIGFYLEILLWNFWEKLLVVAAGCALVRLGLLVNMNKGTIFFSLIFISQYM
jgi:hypothetical protein